MIDPEVSQKCQDTTEADTEPEGGNGYSSNQKKSTLQ